MSGVYHRDDIPEDLRRYFVRAEIGLEPTPDEFVAAMVDVFREVRRVLRDDGTLWLNLGDSYAGNSDRASMRLGAHERGCTCSYCTMPTKGLPSKVPAGLKPKDLIGIPWRVAFALQADGWYLRQDIIWHKPNPMPESVRDRCTKAHEYIFLLTKSPKYHYDHEAIKEPSADPEGSFARYKSAFGGKKSEALLTTGQVHTRPIGMREFGGKRNRRSVWSITTRPFNEAHFATFPPELAETCIKAGTRPGDMVLDPFGGAGTTGLVANQLGRDCTLIELNPEYAEMARKRIARDGGMFAQVEIAA